MFKLKPHFLLSCIALCLALVSSYVPCTAQPRIFAGQGIGSIRIGGTRDSVLNAFGQPVKSIVWETLPIRQDIWTHNGTGARMVVLYATGSDRVVQIETNDSQLYTPSGISVQSTNKEILNSLPPNWKGVFFKSLSPTNSQHFALAYSASMGIGFCFNVTQQRVQKCEKVIVFSTQLSMPIVSTGVYRPITGEEMQNYYKGLAERTRTSRNARTPAKTPQLSPAQQKQIRDEQNRRKVKYLAQQAAQKKAALELAKRQQQEQAKQRLAEAKRQKEEALAAAKAANQNRVDEEKERLAQAQREVEQAKAAQAEKEDADAEIARLKAETAKAEAEKARLDAEAEKARQEEATRKAKELADAEAKKQAAIEVLQNTPSIIAGQQLGNIRLGMSEAEVVQLIGTPDSSLPLRKVQPHNTNPNVEYYPAFVPRKIRRARYYLKAVDGLEVTYQGESHALQAVSKERGIDTVQEGELKLSFVFDVFYVSNRVVQIESDSPQFFTADKKNIQTGFDFVNPYKSDFIADFRFDDGSTDVRDVGDRQPPQRGWNGSSGGQMFGAIYTGSKETGLSVRLEGLSGQGTRLGGLPNPLSPSLIKVVVHAPNTVPYTGDFQLGISLVNKAAGRSDADNVEERMYSNPLNPSTAATVASKVLNGTNTPESLKEKVRRKLGDFLPKR